VSGTSLDTWDGPAGQSPLHAYSGDTSDIFILKLNNSGVYQWHTFYGAKNSSYKYSIAVDKRSEIYVTGLSTATWNGDGNAAPLHSFSGTSDTYILKLNAGGAYSWHTFYGSFDPIYGNNGIAADSSGNVYVAGITGADWNGDGNAPPLHTYSGGWDIFVLKLADRPRSSLMGVMLLLLSEPLAK
jgi:hypothetical protein